MDELLDVCLKDRAKTTVQKYTDTLESHLHVKDIQNQESQNRDKEIQRVQNVALAKLEETQAIHQDSCEREKEITQVIDQAIDKYNRYAEKADRLESYIANQTALLEAEIERQNQRELAKQAALDKAKTIEKSIDRDRDKGFGFEM